MKACVKFSKNGSTLYRNGNLRGRSGAAFLLAIFIMTLVGSLSIAMADTQMMRYAALRNTRDWDYARYLAEAGLNHAFSKLEADIAWRKGIPETEFPEGSGHYYSAVLTDGVDGTVVINALGKVANFQRTLTATVKQGG